MNLRISSATRPVPPAPTALLPLRAAFARPAPLTVLLPRQLAVRHLAPRPFATSRAGYDHAWIGSLVLFAAWFVSILVPARAAEPMDGWTKATVSAGALTSVNDLIFVNGEYWAAGATGKVQHSPDGINWTVVQTPATSHVLSLAYANGRFVAIGYNYVIMSSPNGTTDWTIHEQDPAANFGAYHQVRFLNGKFIVVGGQGRVRTSPNGVNWTPAAMNGTSFYPNQVAWGNNLYVAVGTMDGYYSVQTSPDGTTWTRRYVSNITSNFESVGFFNGLFIASAESVLATSPDGVTWTKLTAITWQYTNITIYGIAAINGRAFAWGEYGVLLSSANGTDWVKHTTGTTLSLSALAYNNERLLSFRFGIITSANGPAYSDPWAPVPAGPTDPVPPTDPNAAAQIANISTRAWIGTGETKLITGFVVSGATAKQLLIRGVGPTLGAFGVPGTIADPKVTLYNSSNQEVATNNDWGTFADQSALATESAKVFAFALTAGSKDAAMVVTLQPGSYTLHVAGADGGTGVALAEVYDCATSQACRLVNISSRGFIGLGDSVAIPGFVVSGNKPKKLLVRGIGPTLGSFGVPGTIADPKITLYDSAQAVVASNDNWSTYANQSDLAAATTKVFAFALSAGSTDAAMLVTVNPGSYTAVVSGNNNGTGVALVEVYEVE